MVGGCARIESNRKSERGFVGTKFFGFKFPRKLALQNYSQLPRRAPNLSMARVCVHDTGSRCPASSSLCAIRLKNISNGRRTSFPHVHVAACVQIARCTNRSIIRPVIEQFFPNRHRTSGNIRTQPRNSDRGDDHL